MKTKMVSAKLAEAVGAVKGVVAKDAISAFGKVRLDVAGSNVSVTGSDGNVQVAWRTTGETKESGVATVSGSALAAFAAAMPAGVVEIDGEGPGRVVLSGGGTTFRLSAGDAAALPAMEGPVDGAEFDVEASVFGEMLRKVAFAACADLTRPALCGVNMALKDGLFGLTATDGRRLAHVELELGGQQKHDLTLPMKAVGLLRGLVGEKGVVTVRADGRSVRFTGESWSLTAKVVDAVFPAWRRVVPEKCAHVAEVRREAFLEALGRVALAADDSRCVKIAVADGSVGFSARSGLSSAKAEIDACVVADGGRGEFQMDHRLMKDALSVVDDDTFRLGFDSGVPVVKLTCSIPWVAVVMPLRKEG